MIKHLVYKSSEVYINEFLSTVKYNLSTITNIFRVIIIQSKNGVPTYKRMCINNEKYVLIVMIHPYAK